jgi:hypothetical protein
MVLIVGAAAGVGLAAYALMRLARRGRAVPKLPPELDSLEEAAVEALRNDEVTGNCAIDVAAIAPGILELSGFVPDHDAAERAVRVLHALTGVRTVVNRLDDSGTSHDVLTHSGAGAVTIPSADGTPALEGA